MDDLISRQAAIEAMRRAKDKSELHRMLVQLPSAQPSVSKSEMVGDVISRQPSATDTNVGGNLIDRQAAIEKVKKLCKGCYLSEHCGKCLAKCLVRKAVKILEKVSPAQPGWIPTSEKLPERYDNYLITTDDEDVDIGTFHPEFKHWSICDADGFRLTDGVLAWCELPTPYREGGQDGKN